MMSRHTAQGLRLPARQPSAALAPLLALALLLPHGGLLRAQSAPPPAAAARLGRDQAAVGERVPLRVTIESASVQLPDPAIYVDGLDIRYAGQQTRVESVNFTMRVSTQLTWIITPLREGEFKIPALAFTADGRRVTTEPLKLRVTSGPAPSGPPQTQPSAPAAPGGPQPGQASAIQDEWFIAELRLPQGRREFYAGELIPVEVVFGVDERLNASIQRDATVSQKDFTVRKLSEPSQGRENRGGRFFSTITYRTAVAAVKPGEVALPRFELPIEVITRAPSPAWPRPPIGRDFDPFDPASVDRLFEEFFNSDPFGGLMPVREEKTLTTPAGTITIRPLPREGRPAAFDGAIGKFHITASARPARPAPGDPVQLRVEIRGEGNFDTVTAPRLDGLRGWRVYPATPQFTPSDETGTAGVKTFDIVLVPGPDAEPLDTVEFAWFDPEAGKYQTARSEPLGIQPQTSAAPAQSAPALTPSQPAAAPATPPRDTRAPSAEPPQPPRDTPAAPDDLLHIQTERPDAPRPLTPPWRAPAFLAVNALIALGLAAVLLAGFARSRFASPENRRRRELAAERARLLAALRSGSESGPALLDAAARLIETHGFSVSPEDKTWVLSLRDQLRYGAGLSAPTDPETLRRRLKEIFRLK